MRKNFYNGIVVAFITLATVACKSDKKNPVDPTDAEAAAIAGEEATEYSIETEESTIKWKGSKPTGEHIGSIDIESGALMANNEEIVSGIVTIDMESISVEDEGISEEDRTNLENHLKGTVEGKETDFFDVTQFPTATFEITGVVEKEGQKYLQGNLTIKEETKNIEFPVTTTINQDELSLKSETFTIDRTDWNVNYGSQSVFDNLGDNFIDDEIELTIEVHALATQ